MAYYNDNKFAPFVPISDLQSTKEVLVRTVGYARTLDLINDTVTLEYLKDTIHIDIRYIQPFKFRKGGILQIMGDLETRRDGDTTQRILKAQLYRNVTGLDMTLYHKVQKLRATQMSSWRWH